MVSIQMAVRQGLPVFFSRLCLYSTPLQQGRRRSLYSKLFVDNRSANRSFDKTKGEKIPVCIYDESA